MNRIKNAILKAGKKIGKSFSVKKSHRGSTKVSGTPPVTTNSLEAIRAFNEKLRKDISGKNPKINQI